MYLYIIAKKIRYLYKKEEKELESDGIGGPMTDQTMRAHNASTKSRSGGQFFSDSPTLR